MVGEGSDGSGGGAVVHRKLGLMIRRGEYEVIVIIVQSKGLANANK